MSKLLQKIFFIILLSIIYINCGDDLSDSDNSSKSTQCNSSCKSCGDSDSLNSNDCPSDELCAIVSFANGSQQACIGGDRYTGQSVSTVICCN